MKISTLRVLALGALLSAAGAALGQASAPVSCFVGDAKVLEWNAIAVDTIGTTPPVPAARFLAVTQLAVFEAVNVITAEYEPYLGTLTAPAGASPEAAAIVAAHAVLEEFFPTAAVRLDQQLTESLETIADDQAKADGITVGEEAAALILAERADDGSTPPQFYLPPDQDPGDWQPTPSCSAAGGAFRHWQDVAPFGIESASQFRAAPPFPITSRRYARDFEEVKTLGATTSAARPQDRADVAVLYAAQQAPVGWNSIARQLASARHDGITQTARTLALLNAAISDSLISVFESKYHYAFWRPETAIVRADEDGNARTAADAAFTPLVVAPCFPSYPSGHGAVAGAASAVLADVYDEGGHDLTNSTPSLPGVVLHYERIHQIVRDISDARVYGGIHFRNDQDAAETLGKQVAAYDIQHLFQKLPGEGHHE
jgi:hypothetical protein